MRHKNANFKFNKKPLKTFKISGNKNRKNFEEYYSKILLDFLEPDKAKDEVKNIINNNDINNKLKKLNKVKLSSNSSNRILKISLNGDSKFNIKNKNDINNNFGKVIKERKTVNINNNKLIAKKLIQSISEKNIINKNNKNISKSDVNINMNLYNFKKNNEIAIHNNIKLNLNNSNKMLNQKSNVNNINNIKNNNNNKERKNKSVGKRKEKTKNFEDKRSINLKININEINSYKNSNYQFKYHQKNNNNKINLNKSLKKRNIKNNNKINKSPDNLVINEKPTANNNIKEKNLIKTKKIITDINSSSRIFNKKKIKKNTDNNSSKNILEKNTKINTLKKQLIDKKSTKIINLNSSITKINNTSKQQGNLKKIKVESIKIDLNVTNPKNNYSFISQEKTTAENPVLNDKINLTLRGTEITKYITKTGNVELNSVGQNDMSELNRSFKTTFSVQARSLSKQRDEKKRNKLDNLEEFNNNEDNSKKLNNILISLSNMRAVNNKDSVIKSEPKKLIDKIRKYKKLQKI